MNPDPVVRKRDADAHTRLEPREPAERANVERADEAPLEEPEATERSRYLRHRACRLDISVHAHAPGLFGKETESVVERRQLRADLTKPLERLVPHGS